MKNIYIVAMAAVIAACSTHPVRCRGGALQPINRAAATTRPHATTKAAATTEPAASSPQAAPREPRL
jgi:hypothetical protein